MMLTMTPRKRTVTWTPAKLRALRRKRGWSQTQAAAKIGLSRRTWISWENNERVPSAAAVHLLDMLSQRKL